MRLQNAKPPYKRFTADLVPAPANLPGNLAIQRTDTEQLIALSEVIGVPNAPFSTIKYQVLEVTPEEKSQLKREGFVIATSIDDLKNWYSQWDGPKPTE